MEIKKNGVLWAQIDGDILKLRLPPEFLGELDGDEKVLILTRQNWNNISWGVRHVLSSIETIGCTFCGGEPKYRPKKGEQVAERICPVLCEKCMKGIRRRVGDDEESAYEEIL